MFAELVFSYFMTNNDPMYLNDPASSSYSAELKLNLHHDFEERFYFDLEPYAMRSREGITGRAGAEADIGVWIGDIAIELYHHSSHNLDHALPDQERRSLEMDAVKLRWRLK